MSKKFYVVTEPRKSRGVYSSWSECEKKVKGISGAKYQKVPTREEGRALLEGKEITLTQGKYVFLDGNYGGGGWDRLR